MDAGRRDDLFDVLSHSHRRFTLRYLESADTPIQVDELTAEIAAREVQRPVHERSGDGREDIEISLIHRHLPKMAEADFVRYDATGRTVALGDRGAEGRSHLRAPMGD